ncbi:MAG: cyclic dehypoxanthinyl futalosine synthase [Thermodesulfovibrionales bacterium]|nr:cyclic dehypoxanthinyl futalosine synthase [Thermodesulfovibrionales bacterium]
MRNKPIKKNTDRLTKKEGLMLLEKADLLELGRMADETRKRLHPEGIVTFIIDRNINYTNICINRCRFCAFWRDEDDPEAYLLEKNELLKKIEETIKLGGTQILIQGGLNPGLDLSYFINLLREIKSRFDMNIHGFSPPEICYMADRANLTIRETLGLLRDAGLDSIPGGGAEILSDRVKEVISPKKIKSDRWLKVMEEAHKLGMKTTATMMFGSIEKAEDIIKHLDAIRGLQDKAGGFTAFIPWSFQPGNTELAKSLELRAQSKNSELRTQNSELFAATAVEYLRVLAISRIYLDNIKNIQASWVTQGLKLAQVALRFGANDFGSTMIEENVIASTGVSYRVSKEDIIKAIRDAEFKPAQRNTYYKIIQYF